MEDDFSTTSYRHRKRRNVPAGCVSTEVNRYHQGSRANSNSSPDSCENYLEDEFDEINLNQSSFNLLKSQQRRNLVYKSVLNEFQPASIQSSPSLYHLVAYVIQHKPQQQQPLPLTTLQNFGYKQNLSIDFGYFSDLCSPRSSGLSSMSQTSPQLDENIWGDSLIWAAPSIDNKKYSMMEEWSGDFNNNRSKSAVRPPPGFNQFSDE